MLTPRPIGRFGLGTDVILALITVYVVWGSTYYAIKVAIETLPPLLMAATRFLVAGPVLFLLARSFGKAPLPTREIWYKAGFSGILLLLGGNGLVVLAEQYVPSAVAALLVGAAPFWFLLFSWIWLDNEKPRLVTVAGLVTGFYGLLVLLGIDLSGSFKDFHTPLIPALAVMGACISWTLGSIFSKKQKITASPFMTAAVQMIVGGVAILFVALLKGEAAQVNPAAFSARSVFAFLYLIVFGSIIGYSAYIYVLSKASTAVASTYAYVNTVVAVLIGWALGKEEITLRTLIATIIIVGSVILISWPRKPSGN